MLRHIVLWKFKESAEGRTRAENVAAVRDGLAALESVVPEVKAMTLGADLGKISGNYDLALIVDTENTETLAAYANHPEHLKVVDYVKKVTEARAALDFTL